MTKFSRSDHRPLVTFAVFTYNQKDFVREAAESALAQTYQPLEVIFSDDCSTDSTYTILTALAQDYDGEHTLIVRRTAKNLGTFNHIKDVAKVARGKYLIVAAGDDISYPYRTQVLVQHMIQNGCWATSSLDDTTPETQTSSLQEANTEYGSSLFRHPTDIPRIHGATAAYLTDGLNLLPDAMGPILFEDFVIQTAFTAIGKRITFLPRPLVTYRHHSDNVSVRASGTISLAHLKTLEFRMASKRRYFIDAHHYLVRHFSDRSTQPPLPLQNPVQSEISFKKISDLHIAGNWWEFRPLQRFAKIQAVHEKNTARMLMPRLFGINFFSIFKYVKKLSIRAILHRC